MMFFRKRTNRSAARMAVITSVALVAAAVWAWELPLKMVGQFFMITLLLTVALMLLAGITVLVIKMVQKVLRKP